MDSCSVCLRPLALTGGSKGRSRASFSDSTASSHSRLPSRLRASMAMLAAGVVEWTPARRLGGPRRPLRVVAVRLPLAMHRQGPGCCFARDQKASIATGACCTACGAAAVRVAGRGALRRTLEAEDENRGLGSRRMWLCTERLRMCDRQSVIRQCEFGVLRDYLQISCDRNFARKHADRTTLGGR